jgi:hypothetical protein
MANLALTFLNEGRWKEAEEVLVQVMETMKRVLGAEHPDTLTSMANLAYTWKFQERRTDALALIQECCKLRNKVLGHNHPDARNSYSTLVNWQEEHNLFLNQIFHPPHLRLNKQSICRRFQHSTLQLRQWLSHPARS